MDIAYFAENNKKIIIKFTVHMRVLFIGLFALFMGGAELRVKKKKKKPKTLNADAQNAQYKQICNVLKDTLLYVCFVPATKAIV